MAGPAPGGDVAQQVDHRGKRLLERRPVLQVERPPEPLARSHRRAAPRARAHRLVPRLQVVHAQRHEDRQGAHDDEVVERLVAAVADPGPLLGVHHVAVVVVQHARGAGVDHDHP